MSDRSQAELADEIAYVRTLAEEGRFAPLLGGRLYVVWGGLTALAAFVSWLDAMDVAPFDGRTGFAPWIAAGIIGWALSFWFGRRARRQPGARTVGNRTANAAWLAVGIYIWLFFGALALVHGNYVAAGVPRYFLFSLMFPVAFGLYGVAFLATASAAGANWFRYVAALSWAFSIGAMALLASPHQMLLAAVGSLVCAVAPGLVLMRGEPSEIV